MEQRNKLLGFIGFILTLLSGIFFMAFSILKSDSFPFESLIQVVTIWALGILFLNINRLNNRFPRLFNGKYKNQYTIRISKDSRPRVRFVKVNHSYSENYYPLFTFVLFLLMLLIGVTTFMDMEDPLAIAAVILLTIMASGIAGYIAYKTSENQEKE